MTCGQKPDYADAIINSFVVMFVMWQVTPETEGILEVVRPGTLFFVYSTNDHQS